MRQKIKLNLMLFSAATIALSSLATVISCSNQVYSTSDIGGLNDWFNPGQKENIKLKESGRKKRTMSRKMKLRIEINRTSQMNQGLVLWKTWQTLGKVIKNNADDSND